MSEMQKNPN